MSEPLLASLLLEGERARLRPVRAEDSETAFAMLYGRREILDWLVWPGPRDLEEVRLYYARWRAEGERGHNYHLAVEERASEAFAGCITARFAGHPGHADLGYWIEPALWGRGLASEAIRLATWLCFEHLSAFLVSAAVFVGNAASRRALERSGFAEDPLASGGNLRPTWHMAVTREAFERATLPWRPQRAEIAFEP